MSGLLEILGRAITVDTSDLIWHWLNEKRQSQAESVQQCHRNHIIDLMGDGKLEEAREQLRLYLFEHPSCCLGPWPFVTTISPTPSNSSIRCTCASPATRWPFTLWRIVMSVSDSRPKPSSSIRIV